MVRIETEPNDKGINKDLLREEVKKEIKKEFFRKDLKGKFKKLFSRFGCLILVILVLAGLLLVGAAVLAKTGLWEIPVVSKIFYQEPKPIRQVAVTKTSTQIMTDLGWRAAKAALRSQSPVISLPLSEEEITVLARDSFSQSSLLSSRLNVDTLQLAIEPSEVEFFSQLYWPKETHLTVGFKPVVEEGKIKLVLTRWRLGGLEMPMSLGNWLLTKILGNRFDQIMTSVLDKINIQEISLDSKEIIFTGSFK